MNRRVARVILTNLAVVIAISQLSLSVFATSTPLEEKNTDKAAEKSAILLTTPENIGTVAGVAVGGDDLDATEYSILDETVVISNDYIKTLSTGEHEITIRGESKRFCSTVIVDNGVPLSFSEFEETIFVQESKILIYMISTIVAATIIIAIALIHRRKQDIALGR